ncbi:MAG: GTP cyclohydrolase II, partial [Rhodopila sp.]|nr:GTP cyclohydrolase II [Rhodopila sp.]
MILGGDTPLVILAAETAGAGGMAELEMIAGVRPVLILAPARAAAILRVPIPADTVSVAIELPDSFRNIETYQSIADPMAVQPVVRDVLRAVPAPPFSDAAIGLAKIGRLLPAILAVPLPNGAKPAITSHGLVEVAADQVLAYAENEVAGLRQVASAEVPLHDAPDSRVVAFRNHGSAIEHLAIVIGRPETHHAPLVRIHSECFTGDLLGSMRCDCG